MESPSRVAPLPGKLGTALAFVLCAALGLWWSLGVSRGEAYGWDESMHAALPAARMATAARTGEWSELSSALLDCQQYPPGYPVALALVQSLSGVSEHAGRVFGRCLWAFGLFGLFLLVREALALERERTEPASTAPLSGGSTSAGGSGSAGSATGSGNAGSAADAARARDAAKAAKSRLAPYITVLLAALSPLCLAFSGTYFLEIPAAVAWIWTLRAWTRRSRAGAGWMRELACGGWLALALFTKWNYGGLLGFALGLDWLAQSLEALRARALRQHLGRTLVLSAIPLLAVVWWFALPWPGGSETAAAHRQAFAGFLHGNQDASMSTPWGRRVLDWSCFLAWSPKLLLVMLAGALCALPLARRPGVRALALVFVAGGLPVWTHNFHLERFLIPGGAVLFALAGIGIARVLPRALPLRLAALALLAAFVLVMPKAGEAAAYALAAGEPKDAAESAARAERLDRMGALGAGRELPTAGLARAEYDGLLDRIARAIGPEERVAWIGANPELSPAALHLGLFARGGSAARLLRDAGRVRSDGMPAMLLTFLPVDPGYSDDQVQAWAASFDVVLGTRPMNWKGRAGYDVLEPYLERLLASGRYKALELGSVEIRRGPERVQPVALYALRR